MSQGIEVVDLLEPKIKSLREEHESRTKFFNECTLSIKRLQNERKNALAAINQIAGAISAYSEVLRVSGAETPAEVEVIPAERD